MMVPAINETLTRLPAGHPLAEGPQSPAVLGTLLGVSDHLRVYQEFAVPELTVRLRSGAQPIAYDGETGDAATEFRFTKRQRLTVYCSR